MKTIVLALTWELAQTWQFAVEDLGEQWHCSPACQAEDALALLPGQELLLILPGPEGEKLLRALDARPPIAPPWVLGGPDGPLPAAEELPGLLMAWRTEGRLPALCRRHLPLAQEMAAALLRVLAVPGRLRAWDFLPEMIALTVVHPPLMRDLRHGLYPLIAGRYGMTAAGVERSLRLCVESTWMHGSLPALERFFGEGIDPEKGKPTNKAFLLGISHQVTAALQRLV